MARRRVLTLLLTSLAPIPFATVPNRETGHMGQNYFRSLFAVGFQGLLILVCVAIYAVLIQSIATDGDPIGAIWGCVGYRGGTATNDKDNVFSCSCPTVPKMV